MNLRGRATPRTCPQRVWCGFPGNQQKNLRLFVPKPVQVRGASHKGGFEAPNVAREMVSPTIDRGVAHKDMVSASCAHGHCQALSSYVAQAHGLVSEYSLCHNKPGGGEIVKSAPESGFIFSGRLPRGVAF